MLERGFDLETTEDIEEEYAPVRNLDGSVGPGPIHNHFSIVTRPNASECMMALPRSCICPADDLRDEGANEVRIEYMLCSVDS